MSVRERHVLEESVVTVAEQARRAEELVELAATSEREDVIVHARMRRLDLLKVKADLERELSTFSPNCRACGLDVHWVSGLGVRTGRWSHAEPAPHGEPVV